MTSVCVYRIIYPSKVWRKDRNNISQREKKSDKENISIGTTEIWVRLTQSSAFPSLQIYDHDCLLTV